MTEDTDRPTMSQAILPSISLERMAEIVGGKPALDIESRALAAEVMRLQEMIADRARLRDSMSVISSIATVQAPALVLVRAMQEEALSHFTGTSHGVAPMPTLDGIMKGGVPCGEVAIVMGATGRIRGRALERVRAAAERLDQPDGRS